jgi:hypothetical protein
MAAVAAAAATVAATVAVAAAATATAAVVHCEGLVSVSSRLPSAADAHQHGQQLLQLAARLPNQWWLRDHRRTRSGAVEVLPSTQRGLARQSTPPVRVMLCM